MYKQSGSRNSRTKGIRVKHILQISLLLGICFWLIYQVKHTHDKKKIQENEAKISADERIGNDISSHGRKELRPLVEEVTAVNEKHGEEEEGEEEEEKDEELPNDKLAIENENYKEETEEEEEDNDNKHNEDEEEHEEEEGEGEENKRAGKELEEEESNGDDDNETNRDEDQVDEEKAGTDDDSEGNESEDNSARVENDNSGQNSHEAREEHYKGDDASSAVAHDDAETENLSSDKSGVSESESSWQDNKSGNATETNGVLQNNSMAGHDKFSEPEESFHQNSTEKLNEQVLANNGTTQVSTEGGNNSTRENTVSELASGQNGTETVSMIKLQNATDEEDKTLQNNELEHGNNQPESNSTVPSVSENITRSNTTVEDESSSKSNSNEEETGKGNGSSESSSEENTDAAQHMSSDSSMAQDVENRIDLDVLPEFKTEGDSNDEDAASE